MHVPERLGDGRAGELTDDDEEEEEEEDRADRIKVPDDPVVRSSHLDGGTWDIE
jgi:hypothetical protein